MSRALRLLVVVIIAAAAVGSASFLAGGGDAEGPQPGGQLQAQEAGPEFIGIVNERLIALPRARLEQTLDRQSRLHIGLLRQTFDWAQIEGSRGSYDFSAYDALVEATAERGVDVLPVLFNPPAFHSTRPDEGAERGTYPPRRLSDMAAFAVASVRRYGPGGSFWRERPELEPVPIRAWQVWNEPNLPVYWRPEPDAGAYARLLAEVGGAIRAVDPEAAVVTGGIPESDSGVPFDTYVRDLYDAGAAGSFDALAIHPYARSAADAVRAVERARRLIDDSGDDAELWVTEVGWASDGPPSEFTVGEQGQARRIRSFLTTLAERREELGLRGVVYFNWQDGTVYVGGSDFWGLHTGLLPLAGEPKPAFDAFMEAAGIVIDTLERRG